MYEDYYIDKWQASILHKSISRKKVSKALQALKDTHCDHKPSYNNHYCNLHMQIVDNCQICGFEIKPTLPFSTKKSLPVTKNIVTTTQTHNEATTTQIHSQNGYPRVIR